MSHATELVPTLRVGMQPGRSASPGYKTAHSGSIRRGRSHAEHGNDSRNCVTPKSMKIFS